MDNLVMMVVSKKRAHPEGQALICFFENVNPGLSLAVLILEFHDYVAVFPLSPSAILIFDHSSLVQRYQSTHKGPPIFAYTRIPGHQTRKTRDRSKGLAKP